MGQVDAMKAPSPMVLRDKDQPCQRAPLEGASQAGVCTEPSLHLSQGAKKMLQVHWLPITLGPLTSPALHLGQLAMRARLQGGG